MTGFERYTKKTRRAMFLEEMEQVVPWAKLCALIEAHYPFGSTWTISTRKENVSVEQMQRRLNALAA